MVNGWRLSDWSVVKESVLPNWVVAARHTESASSLRRLRENHGATILARYLRDGVVHGVRVETPNAQLTHGSLAAADGMKTVRGEGAEAAQAASVTEPVKPRPRSYNNPPGEPLGAAYC